MGTGASTHYSKHKKPLSITTTSSTTVKVIHSIDGKLQQFRQPVTAGNVLSDHQPDMFFLCSSEDMFVNCHVPHVPGNEELQMGHIYFMMPVSKLYRPVSLQELCVLAVKASSALEKSSSLKMRKMGRTTSSSLETKKMGRTTSSGSEMKKMGRTTSSSSGMKKMGGTTSCSSKTKKMGRTTSSGSEMKKMGRTTSSSSEMKKMGRTTSSSSEMKKVGGTTSCSSKTKKMGRTTSSSGRRKRNSRVRRRYEKLDFQEALKRL